MALPQDKWYDNSEGEFVSGDKVFSFYCDYACIHCFICQEYSPDNFSSSDDKDHSIVLRQPSNKEELELCLEAMECCPVEAIGHDGHLSKEKKFKRE